MDKTGSLRLQLGIIILQVQLGTVDNGQKTILMFLLFLPHISVCGWGTEVRYYVSLLVIHACFCQIYFVCIQSLEYLLTEFSSSLACAFVLKFEL